MAADRERENSKRAKNAKHEALNPSKIKKKFLKKLGAYDRDDYFRLMLTKLRTPYPVPCTTAPRITGLR